MVESLKEIEAMVDKLPVALKASVKKALKVIEKIDPDKKIFHLSDDEAKELNG
jgi:Cu/Ag efflux protein CusF